MRARLLKALARLASEQYQDTYVIHGTPEEYVLPEDLIEDVANLCLLSSESQYRTLFTSNEHAALESILQVIRNFESNCCSEIENSNLEHLIHHNSNWSSLRSRAEYTLNILGGRAYLNDLI